MRRFLIASLLSLSIPAFAQMQPNPPQPPKPMEPKEAAAKFVERMTSELELTPDQAKKILAVAEPAAVKEADLLKTLRDHQRATHEKIRSLLNDEQREKFDMMRLRRPPQPGQGQAPGGPEAGAPGAGMPPKPGEAPKKAPAKAAAPAKP